MSVFTPAEYWKFRSTQAPAESDRDRLRHVKPIVVGYKVFITCWSGYATGPQNPGSMEDLKRHLICVDRATGKELWNCAIKAKLPEFACRTSARRSSQTRLLRMSSSR